MTRVALTLADRLATLIRLREARGAGQDELELLLELERALGQADVPALTGNVLAVLPEWERMKADGRTVKLIERPVTVERPEPYSVVIWKPGLIRAVKSHAHTFCDAMHLADEQAQHWLKSNARRLG